MTLRSPQPFRIPSLSLFVPFHLFYPLFSSVVFVVGMMFVKNAIARGASPWTGTLLANLWLAISWALFGSVQGELLPAGGWGQAIIISLAFVLGQLFTYLAFQHGEVSVATPVFGVKVIIVAALVAMTADGQIPERVWVGAFLATMGIGFVQTGTRSNAEKDGLSTRRAMLTIVLALGAAVSLSLFDVGLQTWGRRWGATAFLPVVFVSTGILSLTFIPWVDRPSRLRNLGTIKPMMIGTLLMAVQAMSMSYSLSAFFDATRINIVYALRGLWAVLLAWVLARSFSGREAEHSRRVMLMRLVGAALLTASVVVALSQPEDVTPPETPTSAADR